MSTRNDFVKPLLVANRSTLAGLLIIAMVLTTISPQAFAASPDFVISAPFPPGSVLPGTGVTTTIYVNSTGGFAGTVNLSVAASPTGILVSITPSVSVPAGGYNTAQLGITTNSAPPANYTVTITGVSGSLTHSTTHSITTSIVVLPPPPSFSATANPSSMILKAGDSAPSTLTITSLYGFAGTVSLTVEVRPGVVPWPTPFNATASVAPANVTISPGSPASAAVQIKTDVSTPTGQYTVWVWAQGGGQIHQAFIQFGVGPYFTMAASPSSLTISASTTGTSTLLLTSHANFSFTANFQLNVYLPGLLICPPYCPIYPTVAISPATFNLPAFGTATTMLTVATAANTTQGTYTITVFGGGCVCLLPTTTITAIVTSPPSRDFTISASPASQTIRKGTSASYTITVAGLNGFNDTVSLSATVSLIMTHGPTITLPSSVGPYSTSILTASTFKSAATGTYTITITATSGSITHGATATLVISRWTDSSQT